jgi:hypothetical protein
VQYPFLGNTGASAFAFSTSTFPEKQHTLKKRFTAKKTATRSIRKKKSKKEGKKGPENKNLFDFAV